MSLDLSKVSNAEIEDVCMSDYPDFCDAHIVYAEYNGIPMTDDQLDVLNDDSDFVHEQVFKHLY
jgi:hypothetical protein